MASTWRSPDSPPLNWREQHMVYRVQCDLRAIKQCQMCEQWLLVSDFLQYGQQPCNECERQIKRARHAHWPQPSRAEASAVAAS